MARHCNENDDDNNKDSTSVVFNLKSALKPELNNSFQHNKTKLGNDALTFVVELAKSLVTETCFRASSHALGVSSEDIELVEKCLPQLMLDFP